VAYVGRLHVASALATLFWLVCEKADLGSRWWRRGRSAASVWSPLAAPAGGWPT
jgi:hypothetical protein